MGLTFYPSAEKVERDEADLVSAEEARRIVLEDPDEGRAFRYFLPFLFTYDKHAPGRPKPFPSYPYVLALADWLVNQRIALIEKSRQMMVTFLCVARCVFGAIRRPGSLIVIQSETEILAGELIEDRAVPMLKNLPDKWFFNHCSYRQKPPRLLIEWPDDTKQPDSKIIGIPQGGQKINSYVCSGIFSDEATKQPEFAEAWASALPTIMSPETEDFDPWMIACGTPKGKDPFFRLIHGEGVAA